MEREAMAERRREGSRPEPGGTNNSPGSDKFDIHFQVTPMQLLIIVSSTHCCSCTGVVLCSGTGEGGESTQYP